MIIKSSWLVLALIHSLPAFAVFKPSLLSKLYGLSPGDTAYTLLQHRAALFLAILVACVWGALKPESRQLACLIVGISMISFLVLYLLSGLPKSLQIIAIADLVGLPFLALVTWQAFFASSS